MRQAYDYWQDQPGYCITESQLIEIRRDRFWKRSSEMSELISLPPLRGARPSPSFQVTECEQPAYLLKESTIARICQVPSWVHVTGFGIGPQRVPIQSPQHSFDIRSVTHACHLIPPPSRGERSEAVSRRKMSMASGGQRALDPQSLDSSSSLRGPGGQPARANRQPTFSEKTEKSAGRRRGPTHLVFSEPTGLVKK